MRPLEDTDAAMRNVRLLVEQNRRDTGITGRDVAPREIRSVGVIGAGVMGAGVAAANVAHGLPVVLVDASSSALAKGVQRVLDEVSRDAGRVRRAATLLRQSRSHDDLCPCDLVIESVVEHPDLKKRIYAELDPRLAPEALLASNTSTLPIADLAEPMRHPERFCGLHFFNPVHEMPLVEVARGPRTDDRTVATAVAYVKRLGKIPIVVRDGPGFLVNRLLVQYLGEALELVRRGAPVEAVDAAARSFGMPFGPLELCDRIGLDTAVLAGRTMWEAFPDRIVVSPVLIRLFKLGRLGCKSGAGFYRYRDGHRESQPDTELAEIIDACATERKSRARDEIIRRLMLPMLLEATRLIEEGAVRDARDVDLGVIFGLGFPRRRGGLLYWADTLGPGRILEMLRPMESLGPRLRPTQLLLEKARKGETFYQG